MTLPDEFFTERTLPWASLPRYEDLRPFTPDPCVPSDFAEAPNTQCDQLGIPFSDLPLCL